MKVLMKKIETISYFDKGKYPMPLRFRVEDENCLNHVIKLERINHVSEDRKAGNPMLIYDCQANVNGQARLLQLIYEIPTCSWYLFKM